MAKKKQARKYVTVSLSRDVLNDVDFFLNYSPFGKVYNSRADFVHKSIQSLLDAILDREVRREVLNLQNWYTKHSDKLQKRGVTSWEDLLDRAVEYTERLGNK